MKTSVIKDIVLASYTKGTLDREKVSLIASKLKRTDLKTYLRFLKQKEATMQVEVTAPKLLNPQQTKKLSALFPEKRVIYTVDPTLLLGLIIKNGDQVYNYNLKHTLEEMAAYVGESYDR